MPKSLMALLLAALAGLALHAADDPALNAAKYPQDTPRSALESLVKSLDNKDYAYYITWLITPGDKERILKKYGTALEYDKAKRQPEQAANMQRMSEVMSALLKNGKQSEGDSNGHKWARFEAARERLQLEKLDDGRWVMNLKPGDK